MLHSWFSIAVKKFFHFAKCIYCLDCPKLSSLGFPVIVGTRSDWNNFSKVFKRRQGTPHPRHSSRGCPHTVPHRLNHYAVTWQPAPPFRLLARPPAPRRLVCRWWMVSYWCIRFIFFATPTAFCICNFEDFFRGDTVAGVFRCLFIFLAVPS